MRESPTTHRNYKTSNVLGTMNLKWVVSHSPSRAAKDKADRDRAIEKPRRPSRILADLKQRLQVSRQSAERQRLSTINWEKINEQAKWDGYYVICTNLNISPHDATAIYRKLWQIEDCFRVSKTCLEARPCFVWTDPHIYGHFLSCFISLVIEKYMLYTFKNELGKEEITHEKMLEALRYS